MNCAVEKFIYKGRAEAVKEAKGIIYLVIISQVLRRILDILIIL